MRHNDPFPEEFMNKCNQVNEALTGVTNGEVNLGLAILGCLTRFLSVRMEENERAMIKSNNRVQEDINKNVERYKKVNNP